MAFLTSGRDVGHQTDRHDSCHPSGDFVANMILLRVKGPYVSFRRGTVDRLCQVLLGLFGDGRTGGHEEEYGNNQYVVFHVIILFFDVLVVMITLLY